MGGQLQQSLWRGKEGGDGYCLSPGRWLLKGKFRFQKSPAVQAWKVASWQILTLVIAQSARGEEEEWAEVWWAGTVGKEESAEPRVRSKTKETPPRWWNTAAYEFLISQSDLWETLPDKIPNSFVFAPRASRHRSKSPLLLNTSGQTHLPPALPAPRWKERGQVQPQFKACWFILILLDVQAQPCLPSIPHFSHFLYQLPIYIGDRKWPEQIEQLLSCWGCWWWGR